MTTLSNGITLTYEEITAKMHTKKTNALKEMALATEKMRLVNPSGRTCRAAISHLREAHVWMDMVEELARRMEKGQ